jgi:hypothetical protein
MVLWLDNWVTSRWSRLLSVGLNSGLELAVDGARLQRFFSLFLADLFSFISGEHALLKFFSVAEAIAFELALEVFLHLFLSLVVEGLDLFDLIDIENIIVTNLLQELEKKWPLGLGSSLGDPLVQIGVEVGLLHDLSDNIGAPNVQVVSLGQLGILNSLLAEGELQHFDPLNQVIIYVFLSLELCGQLVDTSGHLLLLKDEFGLTGVTGALLVLQEIHNAVHSKIIADVHVALVSWVSSARPSRSVLAS